MKNVIWNAYSTSRHPIEPAMCWQHLFVMLGARQWYESATVHCCRCLGFASQVVGSEAYRSIWTKGTEPFISGPDSLLLGSTRSWSTGFMCHCIASTYSRSFIVFLLCGASSKNFSSQGMKVLHNDCFQYLKNFLILSAQRCPFQHCPDSGVPWNLPNLLKNNVVFSGGSDNKVKAWEPTQNSVGVVAQVWLFWRLHTDSVFSTTLRWSTLVGWKIKTSF